MNLTTELDFISFHYYRKTQRFLASYNALQDAINNKPIVLQEYGYSSYDGIWNAYKGSEEDQANYYKEMQTMITNANYHSYYGHFMILRRYRIMS
ncbi:glycosyl hydrolase [Winogradskyella maritima]|nr:glycosyl hydrolase [Winogradskyella maritima]